MAHVERDIEEIRNQAAKKSQQAAQFRKQGDNKKAKELEGQAKALINQVNELRVLGSRKQPSILDLTP